MLRGYLPLLCLIKAYRDIIQDVSSIPIENLEERKHLAVGKKCMTNKKMQLIKRTASKRTPGHLVGHNSKCGCDSLQWIF